MYYMDDLAGRGGHLSTNRGCRSRAEDSGTLQNGEDNGGRGSAGLQNGEDKEKGDARAVHR
jgi:hypothetical protein